MPESRVTDKSRLRKALHVQPKTIFQLLKETFSEWSDDQAPRLGAALAYYTIFSIAPLLLIIIAIVGFFWGNQSGMVQARILSEVQSLVGTSGREVVTSILEGTARPGSGSILATIFGVIALLFGATGVFAQLQGALNWMWDVKPKPERGFKNFVMTRVLSFGMILGVGFLLLVSLVISAALSALGGFLSGLAPQMAGVMQALNQLISFGVITLLFAMIYYYLPDVEIAWRDVIMGAAITALLFTIGKFALGLYLGNTSAASSYGAAGSLVVLLIWIYYSAQIFFLGAEFTQVYARRYGSRIRPSSYAVRIVTATKTEDEIEAEEAAALEAQNKPLVELPRAEPRARPSKLKRWLPIILAFLAGRILSHHD